MASANSPYLTLQRRHVQTENTECVDILGLISAESGSAHRVVTAEQRHAIIGGTSVVAS